MADKKQEKMLELFFPYYVNQGRLLDIYAILNKGYSEYSEITSGISSEKSKAGKAELSGGGGFKIFNFGATASGQIETSDNLSNENKEKKVHTVTSVLSIVITTLNEKGYLKDIEAAVPGQFVCFPVTLKINSIKSLLSEMAELMKLTSNMQKFDEKIKITIKDTKSMEDAIKSILVMFNGEEILFETEKYAVISNIVDDNLYQATRSDIIGTQLTCLAQIKRVFPDGAELMKNTIFTKIKNPSAKQIFIEAINSLADGNIFDFEASAVASIHDKPVYQLEIIALYQ